MPYLQKIQRAIGNPAPAPARTLTPTVARTVMAWSQMAQPTTDEGVAKIEVHDTVSNMAWAYEKFRQAIDYQDEHLLRKNAIERILKRRLASGVTAEHLAEPLVLELIRGRYLPNNSLPVTVIDRTAEIINRYIHLWSRVPTLTDANEGRKLFEWYLGLMAVELNELYSPTQREELLGKLMLHLTQRDIVIDASDMSERDKNTQLYIAIHRALLKSDSEIIRFHLFIRQHPEWFTADEEVVGVIGQQLPELRNRIETELFHPSGELLQRVMKKYAIIFQILDDLERQYRPEAIERLSQPETVVKDIETAYAKRRKTVTSKITRNIIRSIIYVFLTKMLLTLLLEVPIDRLFYGENINYLPLIVNTVFPPILLLLIGVTIRPPGKKNEDAVVEKVQALIYRGDEPHALVKPRKPIHRSTVFTYLYRFFYALIFITVFGGLVTVLTSFGFTPISTFIFILFLTIVSFFGIRVRLLARELLVVDQRENIFTVLFDFFTVPILQVGRWISLRVPRINVLIFFLDFIIEAPFKAFLEATEGFFGFLREKREEIY